MPLIMLKSMLNKKGLGKGLLGDMMPNNDSHLNLYLFFQIASEI